MPDKDNIPALFDWLGLVMNREAKHKGEPCPLLEALLPALEYTPEQLKKGGFLDGVLTAALRSRSQIRKAADELKTLGIFEEDLLLLLQDRMREQIKIQRQKRRRAKA